MARQRPQAGAAGEPARLSVDRGWGLPCAGRRGAGRLPKLLDGLADIPVASRQLEDHVRAIRELTKLKLDELAETIRLQHSGPPRCRACAREDRRGARLHGARAPGAVEGEDARAPRSFSCSRVASRSACAMATCRSVRANSSWCPRASSAARSLKKRRTC